MLFIPKEWCWTSRLEAFAQQMADNAALAWWRENLVRLLRDRNARRVCLHKWEVAAEQFAQCERAPTEFFHRDPEAADLAAIEIRTLCAQFTPGQFPDLFRTAESIAGVANRTRTLRQRIHLAAYRTPAQA